MIPFESKFTAPNAIRIQPAPGTPGKAQTFYAGKEVVLKKGQAMQIIKQKGLPQQIMTLVKNSSGQMAVSGLPKTNLIQATTTLQQPGKNTIVKIVPTNSKMLTTVKTVSSNVLHMNKAGKFVLTKGNAGQLSAIGSQQVLVVSSNAGLRTIQTITNAQAVNVQQVKTTTVNVTPVASASTVGLHSVKLGGKPITISMPMNVVSATKGVTLGKGTVCSMAFRANRFNNELFFFFSETGYDWGKTCDSPNGRIEQDAYSSATAAGWKNCASTSNFDGSFSHYIGAA